MSEVNYEEMSVTELHNQITYFIQEIEDQQRVELTTREKEHLEYLFRLKKEKENENA